MAQQLFKPGEIFSVLGQSSAEKVPIYSECKSIRKAHRLRRLSVHIELEGLKVTQALKYLPESEFEVEVH
ncbi:hypothetical protein [Nostoc sp.]|uniref:hypothetical protein n=1 Tax=Nostoc sp. TaxID=1180 RepID=UPI002FF83FAA